MQEQTYLLAPTGDYSVGYQTAPLTLQLEKEDVPKELVLRVYYPSEEKISANAAYYPEGIAQLQQDIRECQIKELTEEQIASLSSVTSAAEENLPILPAKQPVIYFSAGLGNTPQLYENMLCDLASHRYIVVGLDNMNRLEPHQAHATLMAVHQEMQVLHSKQNGIFAYMDLQRAGLLGHSTGGVAVVLAAQQKFSPFQAMIALDAPAYIPDPNTPSYNIRKACTIPAMQIHASTWIHNYSNKIRTYLGAGRFRTGKNGYHVVLTNKEDNLFYSDHNNFEDFSTLQFHPAIHAFNQKITEQPDFAEELHTKNMIGVNRLQLGLCDGYQTARTINQYLRDFYAVFLLQQKNDLFFSEEYALPHSHFLDWSKPQLREALPLPNAAVIRHIALGGIMQTADRQAQNPLPASAEANNETTAIRVVV